jgi:drug/metabolite transporter (DMT)-like permease
VGQRHAQPADAAIILSSETVFAALFGAWLMGDRLGSAALAGCALILAGIILVQLLPLLRTATAATRP